MEQLDKHLTPREEADAAARQEVQERNGNIESINIALSGQDTQLGKQAVDSVAKKLYEETLGTLDARNPDYQTQLGKLNEAAIHFQGEMNALYASGRTSAEEIAAKLALFRESLQGAIGATEKENAQRAERQARSMQEEWSQREKGLQERKEELLKQLAEQVEQWRAQQQRERARNAQDAGNEEARASQESATSLIEQESWSFPEKPRA